MAGTPDNKEHKPGIATGLAWLIRPLPVVSHRQRSRQVLNTSHPAQAAHCRNGRNGQTAGTGAYDLSILFSLLVCPGYPPIANRVIM
ncbi:MAG: hypothetical protein QM703_27150 [Gemmatales bacterium]